MGDTQEIHLAYVMWHFPLLSETFIQRELSALVDKGVRIAILADGVCDSQMLDDAARRLIDCTVAVLPLEQKRYREFLRYFIKVAPIRTIRTLLFLWFTRYHETNHRRFDLHVFRKSIYIAGLCKNLGITQIHSPWSDLNAITGMLASKLLNVPFTVQARAHDIHRKSYQHGFRAKFGHARSVITNTRYNVNCLAQIMGPKNSRKICHIYNGIPLEKFSYRNPVEINDRPVYLLTVARLIEQKGIDDLLLVYHDLLSEGVDFHATVVGDPEVGYESYALEMQQQCRSLDLELNVDFVGARSQREIQDYYHSSDIFVLPSKIASDGSRDIIPNVLIEAMATGLPCISTKLTGIPEIIDNGVDGILVECSDVQGLTEAILELTANFETRKKMSLNARKKVQSLFDIDLNAEEYLKVFKSAAEGAS